MTHHASLHADKYHSAISTGPSNRSPLLQKPSFSTFQHRRAQGQGETKALYERLMLAIRRERRVQKSLCTASFAVNAVVKQ